MGSFIMVFFIFIFEFHSSVLLLTKTIKNNFDHLNKVEIK